MALYLVRHGQATAGIEELDPGLDELGQAQARAAATALRRVGAVRLITSPLRRARETAAPIAEALELAAEEQRSVAEVFDPAWPVEERRALLGPLLSGRWRDQNKALQDWRHRLLRALLALEGECSVVVSHYVAIAAAIGEATGDDRVSPCALANASITHLEMVGGRFILRAAGAVAHLTPEQVVAGRALAGS